MQNPECYVELTMDELRAITRYAAACAEPAARHAASAAGDASAAAYLHPLAKATQVRHILGAAAEAARAAELAQGDDPVVVEYAITAAAKRTTPVVRDVLGRYPRAPRGGSRVALLMQPLDTCSGTRHRPRARGRRPGPVLPWDQGRPAPG